MDVYTEIEALEKGIERFNKRGLSFAVGQTLNKSAYEASVYAKKHLKDDMILRNAWTARGIQYRKVTTRDVDQMASQFGHIDEYMAKQEEGFTKTGLDATIPTSASAGQPGANPRTKLVRKANKRKNFKPMLLKQRVKSIKQHTLRTTQEAVKTGNRIVVLAPRGKESLGVYKVMGGRKGGRGWPKGAKLRMLWSMSRKTTRTAPNRWMEPGADYVYKHMPKWYVEALRRQIEKDIEYRLKKGKSIY